MGSRQSSAFHSRIKFDIRWPVHPHWRLCRPLVIIILMSIFQAKSYATGPHTFRTGHHSSTVRESLGNCFILEEQLLLLEFHTAQFRCRRQCAFYLHHGPRTPFIFPVSHIGHQTLHMQLTEKAESQVLQLLNVGSFSDPPPRLRRTASTKQRWHRAALLLPAPPWAPTPGRTGVGGGVPHGSKF